MLFRSDEVVAGLRIGKRTLEQWLATDLLRAVDDRRFQFHTQRGRKRIWSETAYRNLEVAIERESAPGGVLATYTCSHHMQDAELRQVLAEVSADARRKLRVLEWAHQPGDHPVLATMPESEYLRGYVVRAD